MDFSNIKACIFDFDGTLADSMGVWTTIGVELLKANNVSYPDSIIRDVTPLGAEGTADYFIKLGLKMTVKEIMKEIGTRSLIEYENNIMLKSGAKKMLDFLKEKNIKMCILSASSELSIIPCMKRLGIESYFDCIVTCDKTKMVKNDKAIYEYTLNKLGVSKDEVLFFDDNLGALKTAFDYGIKTVGVYDESSGIDMEEIKKTVDFYINSFYEITGINIVMLDAGTLGEDINLNPIKEIGKTTVYNSTKNNEISKRIENADVVVINKIKMNEETLKNAKHLQLICVTATGFDNVDTDYCKFNGISVCNVKGYSTKSVALVTMATVLSLYTNLFSYRNFVNSGEYSNSMCANSVTPVFNEICGKTWGIIGYGNIGKSVGEAAKSLGCNVIYTKNTPDENSVSLEYLLKNSDIITIHTPLTDKTRNLINKEKTEMLKDGVILVNESRGAVLNEQDIADAVKTGKIAGFGTDVYVKEPMEENHPYTQIMNMDNVCLTPHMAWGAYEARMRCIAEVSENIKTFINNKKRNRIV